MQVYLNSTGQLGDIPDNKFDPKLFTPVTKQTQNTQASQPQPQSDLASSLGKGALDILGNIFPAVKNYASNTLGEIGKVQQLNQSNPQAAQQEASSYLNNSSGNPLADLLTGSGRARQNLAPAAELSSLAIPFGKGSNFVSKFLAPGAAVGAIQGAAAPNATPSSVIGNTLLGAGGAGALGGLGKILTGGASGIGKVSGGVGDFLRSDVNKINLEPGLYNASKEKAINDVVNKYTTGNAQQKYEQIGPAAQNLYKNTIEPELATNAKPVSTDYIKSQFVDYLDKNKVSLGLSGNKAKTASSNFLKDVFTSENGPLPSEINTDRIFQLKKDLNANNGMNQIFNKLKSADGAPLTDVEKVKLAAYNTLDNIITKEHPNIKVATKEYGLLTDAASSLKSASGEGFKIPVLGQVPLTATVGRSGEDLLGRVLSGANVSTPQASPTLQNILGQGAARVGGAVNSLPVSQDTNNQQQAVANASDYNPQSDNTQSQINNDNSIPQGPQRTVSLDQLNQVQQAVATGQLSAKSADRIQKIYDNESAAIKDYQSTNKPQTPKDQQAQNGLLNESKVLTDSINGLGGQLGQGNVILSNILGVGGKGNPDIQKLQAQITAYRQNLSTVLHRRGMSDAQFKQMSPLFPEPGKDSPQQMQSKMSAINQVVNTFFQQ